MSRWLRERLRHRGVTVIGVDTDTAAWRADGQLVSMPAADASVEGPGVSRTRAWLLVAGLDLSVHWLQTVPAAVRSLDELRQVAAARCAQLHGGTSEDWCVAGDWTLASEFACAALPQAALAPWVQQARTQGVALRVETAWTAACAVAGPSMPDAGWCGLAGPGASLAWHIHDGRVDCIVPMALAPDETPEQMSRRAAPHLLLARLRAPHLSSGDIDWQFPEHRRLSASQALAALDWGGRLAGSLS